MPKAFGDGRSIRLTIGGGGISESEPSFPGWHYWLLRVVPLSANHLRIWARFWGVFPGRPARSRLYGDDCGMYNRRGDIWVDGWDNCGVSRSGKRTVANQMSEIALQNLGVRASLADLPNG